MTVDEVNMNRETVRLIVTEELGIRRISATTVPSHTATVGCAVEGSF